MLPKQQRLHTAADFRRTRKGRQWRSTSFLAFIQPNRAQTLRMGVIVSAKIGKAVVRKRASRILREASRQLQADLGGRDIVFIARPLIKSKTTGDIAAEIKKMTTLLR